MATDDCRALFLRRRIILSSRKTEENPFFSTNTFFDMIIICKILQLRQLYNRIPMQ